MEIAVSAMEKATVEALLILAQRAGKKMDCSALTNLLDWAKEWGLLTDSSNVFKEDVWEKIGTEIWEEVQADSREAQQLAPVYRRARLLIEGLEAEAELDRAMRRVLAVATGRGPPETPPASLLQPALLLALPPPGASNPLVTDPAAISLPGPSVEMDKEDSEFEALGSLLRSHSRTMIDLVDEIRRLDMGSSQSMVNEVYKRAHKAIMEGLHNIEEQLHHTAPIVDSNRQVEKRQHVLGMLRNNSWNLSAANQYLLNKGLDPITSAEWKGVISYRRQANHSYAKEEGVTGCSAGGGMVTGKLP